MSTRAGSTGWLRSVYAGAVAWFEDHEQNVMELAKRSAEVTQNHPEGIKGARATAMAILWARKGISREVIRHDIEAQFDY